MIAKLEIWWCGVFQTESYPTDQFRIHSYVDVFFAVTMHFLETQKYHRKGLIDEDEYSRVLSPPVWFPGVCADLFVFLHENSWFNFVPAKPVFPVRQSQNACGNHVSLPSRRNDPVSGQSLNLRCLVSGYIGDLPGGMS